MNSLGKVFEFGTPRVLKQDKTYAGKAKREQQNLLGSRERSQVNAAVLALQPIRPQLIHPMLFH